MDTERRVNKSLIRSALDKACKELNNENFTEDAVRYESSMQNTSGTPEVAATLFKQIEESHAFLADLTLVGQVTGSESRKRLFNPNVNLELGYAAGVLGWERIICVCNENYGAIREQPFDVQNRRHPISYNLEPGGENNGAVKTQLTKDIKNAVKAIEQEDLRRVEDAIRRLDQHCLQALNYFAGKESFAIQFAMPGKEGNGARMLNGIIEKSIRRLLDLDLVWTDYNSARKMYGYHWTYLGKKVIERITKRTINEIRQGQLEVDALQAEISKTLEGFKH